MQYNYATDVAAGACPECGQALILYHHVQLTAGKERRKFTSLETIFCRECVERMSAPDVGRTFLSADEDRHECLPHGPRG
jgi:hypothetical protein